MIFIRALTSLETFLPTLTPQFAKLYENDSNLLDCMLK